ncbi:hypothetical protein E2C01_043490 [Portunus trituberculatus]|uniref:Uncharacterized protein n=1 Tax=Portunus trituberculatus TaxID=210409 RepID=A0A5B7FWV1_PORTR|nr:hypothetical protein [Portunus trituberculatus]
MCLPEAGRHAAPPPAAGALLACHTPVGAAQPTRGPSLDLRDPAAKILNQKGVFMVKVLCVTGGAVLLPGPRGQEACPGPAQRPSRPAQSSLWSCSSTTTTTTTTTTSNNSSSSVLQQPEEAERRR